MSILGFVRKRCPLLFIVAVCVACAAVSISCRSNEKAPPQQERAQAPSSSTPTQATVPLETDKRSIIVTFGDSLTAGVAGRSYPDDLQDMLDQNGLQFRVDNQGVSGDTTSDGLARIQNVIAEHPNLVILEFGGNDGLRGIPVDATRKNLEEMIKELQDAGIPVVLLGITLPPNYGPDYVKPFTAMFSDLARQFHLTYLPFLLVHVYQHAELMQPDGIHPNGEGNKIVARDVFQLVRPILTRRHR